MYQLIKEPINFIRSVLIFTVGLLWVNMSWASFSAGLSASASNGGSYSVSWSSAPVGYYGGAFLQENVGNGYSRVYILSSSSGSFAFSNKPDGSYSYRIHRHECLPYAPCTDTYSETVSVTVGPIKPSVPPSISAPATDNNGAFTVSWGASSGTVTSYKLDQQKNGGSWSQIYSGTATSKALGGLGDGTYRYQVWACNGTACSIPRSMVSSSVIVANAPSTPASISSPGTANNGAFTVSWGASTGTVDAYHLDQQANGGSWAEIYTGTATSYAVNGLADGSYTFRVRARNTYSTYSAYSGYSTAGTTLVASAPGTPASISGVPTTNNTGAFTVSWGASTGTVDNYRLEQQKNGGSWTQIYSVTGTSKALSGLGDGTYSFRIRACNEYSTYAACSSYRTSGSSIVANAPSTPASISSPGTANNGAFTVSWGASTGTVDAYHLEQQVNGGSWIEIYTGTATFYAVNGLADGSYTFRVRARNSYSTYSVYSGYRTAGTTLVVNAPGSPEFISSPASVNNGAVTVSWGASSGTVDAYHLDQQANAGSWVEIYTGMATSHDIRGLADGVYAFRVRARNSYSGSTVYSAYRTAGTTSVTNSEPAPGLALTYEYDALGRLITVTDRLNGDSTYDYDPAGNRKDVTDNGDSGSQ